MLGAMTALLRVSIGHDVAHSPTLAVELVHLCVYGTLLACPCLHCLEHMCEDAVGVTGLCRC